MNESADRFAASAYFWLHTAGGVRFIPLGTSGEVVLWPVRDDPELWDVVHVPPHGVWERLHTRLDLTAAVTVSESEAVARSGLNAARSASWRKRRVSDQQRILAADLGIQLPESGDLRAGEVSDQITALIASRKLDRFLP